MIRTFLMENLEEKFNKLNTKNAKPKISIDQGKVAKEPKYRWKNLDTGMELSAGGVLFYDNDGVWIIKEQKNSKIEYTDIGGKYQPEDGDIYATIKREFAEELYSSAELSRKSIVIMANRTENLVVFVDDHQNRPRYMCIIAHIKELHERGENLDPQLFQTCRKKVLLENPRIPLSCYPSLELCHLSFTQLYDHNTPLSFRLRVIAKKARSKFLNS